MSPPRIFIQSHQVHLTMLQSYTCVQYTVIHIIQHIQQQSFYGPLPKTTWVSRYQKKHSPTHHPDRHPVQLLHLLRSIASLLFKLHAWQSFCTTSPHVLFGLPLGLEPIHLILHTFLHPVTVFFSQHMPIPSQPVLVLYQYYIIYS